MRAAVENLKTKVIVDLAGGSDVKKMSRRVQWVDFDGTDFQSCVHHAPA